MTATIIILVLIFIGLLYNANLHGKDKTGKHNFWTSLVAAIIQLILFYFAGMFDKFK